jgi:hypothetical protein
MPEETTAAKPEKETTASKPAKETPAKETPVSWALSQQHGEESIAELVARLNTAVEIDNPVPAKLLPAEVTMDQIRATVPPAEAFKVLSTPIWGLIAKALENGDMASVSYNITALVAGGCLSKETAGALGKLFVGKNPDPSWSPTVFKAPIEVAGFEFRFITEAELNTVIDAKNAELAAQLEQEPASSPA